MSDQNQNTEPSTVAVPPVMAPPSTIDVPIKSSEPAGQVWSALLSAQAEMKMVAQSGRNDHDNYDYSKLTDVILASAPVLNKHGLVVVNSIQSVQSMARRPSKSGTPWYATRVWIATRVVHAESGEWVETYTAGDGQDSGDKGIYKAITGARKYGLSSTLNLASKNDDPEASRGADLRDGEQPVGNRRPRRGQPAGAGGEDLL